MGELDAEFRRSMAATMRDNARQGRFAIVRIEPEAAVGNTSTALDARGFDHDERRAGIAQHA